MYFIWLYKDLDVQLLDKVARLIMHGTHSGLNVICLGRQNPHTDFTNDFHGFHSSIHSRHMPPSIPTEVQTSSQMRYMYLCSIHTCFINIHITQHKADLFFNLCAVKLLAISKSLLWSKSNYMSSWFELIKMLIFQNDWVLFVFFSFIFTYCLLRLLSSILEAMCILLIQRPEHYYFFTTSTNTVP